jgi:hypothetical protein
MKLEQLNLDIAGVVSAPLKRTTPEPEWIAVKESAIIPTELFRLYEAAGFLSFGAAPTFLRDQKHVLFSYYGMLVRSLKQQMQDAADLLQELGQAHALLYDPVKKAKGIAWDPGADDRSRRAFRALVIADYSALDITAELAAVLFTGRIPQVSVGRAQFGALEDWLRAGAGPTALVLSPADALLSDFRAALTPIVLPVDAERDWVRLVRLLRNKGAHLGDEAFRSFGLLGADDTLYLFLPREWPYFFEQDIKPSGSEPEQSLRELLMRTLIHEDYISFAAGLNRKVCSVIDSACRIFRSAYVTFADFPFNELALKELRKNSRAYDFRHFTEPSLDPARHATGTEK